MAENVTQSALASQQKPEASKPKKRVIKITAGQTLPNPVLTKGQVGLKREDTRSEIAKSYVKGFLYIITIALIGCGILLYLGKITFENLTQIIVTLSGILSGALGFVIGYYFKSGENNGNE